MRRIYPTSHLGKGAETRWHEVPLIKFVPEGEAASEDEQIRLAKVEIDSSGVIDKEKFNESWKSVRRVAGTKAVIGALTSINDVTSPDGNIALVNDDAITVTLDEDANCITIGEIHSGLEDNPHFVTPAQIGALPTSGGTVNGVFMVNRSTGGMGSGSSAYVQNAHAAARTALIVENGPRDHGTFSRDTLVNAAALMVISYIDGWRGFFVRGSGYIVGDLEVTGDLISTKVGYVVDRHVNGSGQRLETGDVVVVKAVEKEDESGNRFRGTNNLIPVVEVSRTSQEDDAKVIGIVAREAKPEQHAPDNRIDPDDPTFIENGSELLVVTLGAFANCKADASEAPIKVGDLLTTSSNPGHARKATEPKIGSIIGKALEPLKEGTGYIAVFVNIRSEATMPTAYFRIPLTVNPTGGGAAELVAPDALQEIDYSYLIVKEGCEEGIVALEAPNAVISELAAADTYEKLTARKMQSVRRGYPPPKLKQRYRLRQEPVGSQDADPSAGPYEVDNEGNRIVDTFQTVRAGFYLIDVPVVQV